MKHDCLCRVRQRTRFAVLHIHRAHTADEHSDQSRTGTEGRGCWVGTGNETH